MNKVFNINLGGYPFTIDDNAYQHLSGYLKTIHSHFKRSEGYEEITSDIETRIAELFQDSLGDHSIVTLKMVKETISIMGTPEEFGADPIDDVYEDAAYQSKGSGSGAEYKTGKRLLRDPENQVIGGVCSGIAAYFGIADPLWVRLGFILFTISGGVGIPAYIILWSILKEAKTSSDRLAMQGADINISNMAQVVEKEFGNITDKISEMAEGWEGTGKKKNFTDKDEIKDGINQVFQLFGKGIKTGIEVLGTVAKPLIFIVGFALIIAFAVVWLVAIISFFLGFPMLQFVMPQQPLIGGILIFNLAVFIGIPILSLIFLASRLVFKTRFNVRWKGGLLAFYILNAVSFFGIASYMLSQFSMGADAHQSSERFTTQGELLNINFTENPFGKSWIQLGPAGMIKLSDDVLVNENIHLQIEKAEGDEFVLIQETSSRGDGLREAKTLAKNIRHEVNQSADQLAIQSYFTLNKGEKWRAQGVQLTLKVPVGKSIQFNNIDRTRGYMVDYVDDHQRHHHLFWAKDNKPYKMEKDGLLGEGISHRPKKEDYDFGPKYQNFSKVHIEGNMKIEITQGDQFSTKITGQDQYLKKIELEQFDDKLMVSTNLRNTSSPVRLYITMPSLTELDLENTDDAKISGFIQSDMLIRSESRADIKALVNVDNLTVKLDGKNELDIRGKGKNLKAYLTAQAQLDAERFTVEVADIKATDRAKAFLAVSDTLRQTLDSRSKIRVDGEPVVLED